MTRRKRLLIGVLLAIPFGWVLFWAFVTVETIITLALTGRL